jgi:hypothetical protein
MDCAAGDYRCVIDGFAVRSSRGARHARDFPDGTPDHRDRGWRDDRTGDYHRHARALVWPAVLAGRQIVGRANRRAIARLASSSACCGGRDRLAAIVRSGPPT